MKSFLLNTMYVLAVAAVCLMNPLAGLTLSQTICEDDDDCLDV